MEQNRFLELRATNDRRHSQQLQKEEAARAQVQKEADRYAKLKRKVEVEYAGMPAMAAEIKQLRLEKAAWKDEKRLVQHLLQAAGNSGET